MHLSVPLWTSHLRRRRQLDESMSGAHELIHFKWPAASKARLLTPARALEARLVDGLTLCGGRNRRRDDPAGVDEAGRGPLAGPVVAAAVVMPPHVDIPGIGDSKALSAERREALYAALMAHPDVDCAT